MRSFKKLTELFSRLEIISSHIKIVNTLAGLFRKLEPEEAKITAYLALGDTGPKYEDTELGLGNRFAVRAIAEAYNIKEEAVQKIFNKKGDLGDTALHFNKNKRSMLTIREVHRKLVKIRNISGEGGHEKKISLLASLLKASSCKESRYIMRIAVGKLRLGFGEQFLIEAFAKAYTKNREADLIKDKYNIDTDIGGIAATLSKNGIDGIKRISIALGRPVQAMLAKRVDSLQELRKRFPGEMAVEEKYDGERVQIHIHKDNIILFSRRLEDITSQFPEIAEGAKKAFKGKTAVLDGEIVAQKNPVQDSFQRLMQRRRKYDVEDYRKQIPVIAFIFDIIYLNSRSQIRKPYPERQKKLKDNITQNKNIKFARRILTSELKELEAFFKKTTDKGYEGIVVKSTAKNSIYQPGKRGFLWVKWKKEYAKGNRDTFDLVIIGSFYGKGRRKNVFGALLCAVRNTKKNVYESFTKVGSGFTEKSVKEINKLLKENWIDRKPADVIIANDMEPDQYIEPKIVIEVLGADITESPHHSAGRNRCKTGYALRFPRFLNIRHDKRPEQATTIEEINRIRQKK